MSEKAGPSDVESNLAFLLRATSRLSISLDVDETLAAIAKLSLPHLGAWCIVDIFDGQGQQRVAIREYVVVQSEFYLESTGDESAYQFEFHRNSMIDKPRMVEPGERVRLYLLNVGTWSAHVIGAIFDQGALSFDSVTACGSYCACGRRDEPFERGQHEAGSTTGGF